MLDTRSLGRLSDQSIVGTMRMVQSRDLTLTQHDVVEDTFATEEYPSRLIRRYVLGAQVDAQLRPLAALGPDWDSYGALPVADNVLGAARDFLTEIVSLGFPFPSLVPTVRGGLSFEWIRPGHEFTITIGDSGDAPNLVTAYYFNEDAGEEWESSQPAVDSRVTAVFKGLRAAP